MQDLVKDFIPVADEVHRLQTGKSADARFFQGFSEEGHYGGRTKPTNTRQGIYAVSASGAFLASVNTTRAEAVVRMLERAIDRFDSIDSKDRVVPEETRKSLATVPRLEDRFPADGLVLRVLSRDLPGALTQRSWHADARNYDWAWFRKAEARAFVPKSFERGQRRRVAGALVSRLVRCHLLDNVRGQTSAFRAKEVQKAELEAIVESKVGARVTLQLRGETRAQRDQGAWPRGFVSTLTGQAVWDLEAERFVRFQLLATGKRWGHTRYNSRQPRRRGRGGDAADRVSEATAEPIGVLLELLPPKATLRVAPAQIWNYGW